MISTEQVHLAKKTNLIDLAGQRVMLRRAAHDEWEGPCPRCGGTDRFHVKEESFLCRKCHPDFGDAIDYMMWLDKVDFAEATQRLTGNLAVKPIAKRQPAPKQIQQPANWRQRAEAIVRNAQTALWDDANTAAHAYLEGRGLHSHVWLQFGLGYRLDTPLPGTWDKRERCYTTAPQPAIVIPWYRAGQLTAVRYRFLHSHEYTDVDGKPRTTKQTATPGSDFTGAFYGGHGLLGAAETLRTLVLCEGELNALSIWQVMHQAAVDVLCLGSESQKVTSAMIDYARQFAQVIIWMDRPQVARTVMASIPGAVGVNSPKGQDANDLLQQGLLGGLLATIRVKACRSDNERARLRWDLWDAIHLRRCDDAGLRTVLTEMSA